MYDFVLPFMAFGAVAAFTPGPNNIMVSASGANYGFRRTLPHIMGIAVGFPLVLVAVGLGFGEVFRLYPAAHTVLKVLGASYLLFLSYKIMTAAPAPAKAEGEASQGKPLTMVQAALFQWVNPKAWTTTVSVVAAYTTLEHYSFQLSTMVGIFFIFGILSASMWTLFGKAIARILSTPRQVRMFNVAMGLLLAASLVPMLMG